MLYRCDVSSVLKVVDRLSTEEGLGEGSLLAPMHRARANTLSRGLARPATSDSKRPRYYKRWIHTDQNVKKYTKIPHNVQNVFSISLKHSLGL